MSRRLPRPAARGIDPLDADVGPNGIRPARRLQPRWAAGGRRCPRRPPSGPAGGRDDQPVALAAALAVRGPRFGHVFADLAAIRDSRHRRRGQRRSRRPSLARSRTSGCRPWPPATWCRSATTRSSRPAAPTGRDRLVPRPLLAGRGAVADDLLARAERVSPTSTVRVLADGLDTALLRTTRSGEQRWAAATAVLRRLSVIAGGPGTGKTTTVGPGPGPPRGTSGRRRRQTAPGGPGRADRQGRGAARGGGARARRGEWTSTPTCGPGSWLVSASTLHRLLGRRPDSSSRFRYDRHNHLPHDVLIVDETSMVSLSLMARAHRGGSSRTPG